MTEITHATLTHEEATARTAALSLSAYHLHLDVSGAHHPDHPDFAVSSRLEFSTTTPDTFVDFLGSAVTCVSVNGSKVDIDFDGSRVYLHDLPTNTDLSVTITGTAKYSRTGQGLHRMVDNADGNTYLYSHLEPSDARRIFPCFDQPDLKAVFHITITAPATWKVLSNQRVAATGNATTPTPATGDCVSVTFAPTPRLSTYLTSFAAGPYTGKHHTWTAPDGSGLEVELGAWARASMEPFLDDEILKVTAQGMDFFHQAFDFPYPWGKYDSIFVPEYNLGAMENPGLVTFTETYLFRSQATRAQHAARTNTILHEMSHMWFGDLVTPRWWDDLWLKESFAEFMGADSSVAATDYAEAWTNFAGQRKNWAYLQDQLPTTHPIKAEIPDVDAARQNFDGITYAKGAAVLKQLVHYVGRENFYAGARDYFKAHAFDAATFDDLLAALRAHTDRDLDRWAHAWLRTSGPDTLTPRVTLTEEGKITELAIHATAQDCLRPHRLDVTVFDQDLTPTTFDVDLAPPEGAREHDTAISAAQGLEAPAIVLINDGDHAYAKVGFDENSLREISTRLSDIPDELSRAVMWSALWNLTRDGKWPVKGYIDAVLNHAPAEANSTLIATAFNNALFATEHYIAADNGQDEARAHLANRLWQLLDAAEPGSDTQLAIARATISALAASPDADAAARLRRVLEGGIGKLAMGPEIRWAILRALAARDATSVAELDAELARDNTLTGAAAHLGARYSFPRAQTKQEVFDLVLSPGKHSNAEVDALLSAFNAPRSAHLRRPFAERFFTLADAIWAAHPIEIANRIVRGLYPEVPEALAATDSLLAQEDKVVAPALRRVLLECQDHLRRALVVQRK